MSAALLCGCVDVCDHGPCCHCVGCQLAPYAAPDEPLTNAELEDLLARWKAVAAKWERIAWTALITAALAVTEAVVCLATDGWPR